MLSVEIGRGKFRLQYSINAKTPRGLLRELVQFYNIHCCGCADAEYYSFAAERSLQAAISRAGLAEDPYRKRYDHQHLIPKDVLRTWGKKLLEQEKKLGTAKTFAELHELVVVASQSESGAGELLTYDTAVRIGAWLELEPETIYLHAGSRKGAGALANLFDIDATLETLIVEALPPELHTLKPRHIENFLCIFAKTFEACSK